MTIFAPIFLTGMVVIGGILSILGINSNPREIGWAVEDSMLWLARRFPARVVYWTAYTVFLVLLAAAVWATREILA